MATTPKASKAVAVASIAINAVAVEWFIRTQSPMAASVAFASAVVSGGIVAVHSAKIWYGKTSPIPSVLRGAALTVGLVAGDIAAAYLLRT